VLRSARAAAHAAGYAEVTLRCVLIFTRVLARWGPRSLPRSGD
jgi:hypothetical protein